MTESNWYAYCQICGEFIGPAYIDYRDRSGTFARIDRCTCTCPIESIKIEILPLGTVPNRPPYVPKKA
jgi:hypothetical protein